VRAAGPLTPISGVDCGAEKLTTGEPEKDWATPPPPLEATLILAALGRHGVEYVLIGGFGAQLHRASVTTDDLDITPRKTPENLQRLAAALKEMGTRLRAEGLPAGGVRIPVDEHPFGQMMTVTFITAHGPLDVALSPDGTGGYDDLVQNAATVLFAGLEIQLADLGDIIRLKDAAGRVKDRAALPELRRRLAEMQSESTDPPRSDGQGGLRP
jgi:hypothetical protein